MMSVIFDYDSLCKEHSIVLGVLNSFYKQNSFLDLLGEISKGRGFGNDVFLITFWDDLCEYDKTFYDRKFEGVEFSYMDDECIISIEDFIYYLNIATGNYIKLQNSDLKKEKAQIFLNKIKERYDVEQK